MSTRTPSDEPPTATTTSERTPPPAELTTRLAFLLKRVQAQLTSAIEPVLAPFDLDWRRLAVLVLLAERGPLPQQDLGTQARVDRTTAVALIDALQASGYVERRRRQEDRRAYDVVLTPSGTTTIREAMAAYDVAEQKLMTGLSDRDRRTLKRALLALVEQR